MGFFSNFLAGGLGWALGGPIGAIIGVVLASIFDSGSQKSLPNDRTRTYRSKTTHSDFRMSLLVLIAAVMKADGRVVKTELNVVKRFLVQTFGESGALEALQLLKGILKEKIEIEPVAAQIGANLNYSSKMELVHMLCIIAFADGQATVSELTLIKRIAQLIGISNSDFQAIWAMFNKQEDKNWAYKVLEIEPNASNEEVKKAYRRMAMKFHPDKLNTMGEEVKKSATEKFKKVNDAYQTIKKERNLN
ncbi:MAG: molecular chaperone DjiA [Paludibacteraceae bacterium]|jgi:DnaJ like chaperone protein|nr:molecular chaperone DjiA [Paludibacteraceae bacterium]HHT61425.1 molecular chaperone DjiA [Bacteroidales bacterium]